jgi:hypothetical protein
MKRTGIGSEHGWGRQMYIEWEQVVWGQQRREKRREKRRGDRKEHEAMLNVLRGSHQSIS